MKHSISVKYLLYTHFFYKEDKDFEKWKNNKPWDELEGVQYLRQHLNGLKELLTSPAYEGLLVLFYAPGFAQCFDCIAEGMKRDELLATNEKLKFAESVKQYIGKILEDYGPLKTRLRFVTPLDLVDVFGRVSERVAEHLRWWFIGPRNAIRYDTPKIVEALVRLRLLGTGLPVFRIDQDVLFRGSEKNPDKGLGNSHIPDLGLFKAIASCLRAYQLRRDEPSVATFLFSASYDTQALLDESRQDKFLSWSRAFATRLFPALPVVPELLDKVGTEYTWDDYANEVFSESLARKFYGLSRAGLKCDRVAGIGRIGGHPTVSVISGAMLCLSEGAILDLPPFSNFGLNVVWIDDHLKYSLHRELRHLTSIELKVEPLLSGAKLDSVMVEKARSPITNLPSYVLGVYLPALLWGTVMDAWITPEPLLKFRAEDLTDEDRETWRNIPRTGQSKALLAAALQDTLEKGHFLEGKRQELNEKLLKAALKRITEVRRQWAELTEDGVDTFASIWAKGTVDSYFKDQEYNGIAAAHIPLSTDIVRAVHLNPHLLLDLNRLIEDATEYIEWTLNWPKIVQVVRSIEQGTLRTDISWTPER